jgi:dTDP-4-dehydrorhamnose reductase
MKILVTGGSGQLADAIFKTNEHEFHGTYHSHALSAGTIGHKLDICDRDSVFSLMRTLKPECVVHCAAIRSVEECEKNKNAAWETNVLGTKNVADACIESGAKMIFISSDNVFDGKNGFYSEQDAPNPINYYGRTKAMGELLTMESEDFVIVRASIILGNHPQGFLQSIINQIRQGNVAAATDMHSSPIIAQELADAILMLAKKNYMGIYHAGCEGKISRYEFVKQFADSSLVKAVTAKELGFIAPRPLDTSFDTIKIKQAGARISTIQETIRRAKSLTFS